jgi:hypothetical protein
LKCSLIFVWSSIKTDEAVSVKTFHFVKQVFLCVIKQISLSIHASLQMVQKERPKFCTPKRFSIFIQKIFAALEKVLFWSYSGMAQLAKTPKQTGILCMVHLLCCYCTSIKRCMAITRKRWCSENVNNESLKNSKKNYSLVSFCSFWHWYD